MMAGVVRSLRALRDAPETNIALFAFLVNFPWEFWQVPFYTGLADAPHWHAVERCTQAALGDAAIALVVFWGVAAVASRSWPLRPAAGAVAGFVLIGVVISLVIEWWSTAIVGRWTYAEGMPILPLLGTGLIPVLQWLLLPPVIVWLVRRQLT